MSKGESVLAHGIIKEGMCLYQTRGNLSVFQ